VFVADRLLYLELQKTGGSHLLRLLDTYTDGATEGKHNRLIRSIDERLVIGSIRNPWDWYVSLWAFGAGGHGAIRMRTARRFDLNYYNRMLPKDMGKNWLSPAEFIRSVYHDAIKPVSRWKATYLDPADPLLFRAWLSLLLDNKRRFDIGEGYGFSPLSAHAGLMTYRYFRLYTVGESIFRDSGLEHASYLERFDKASNITGAMIRNESLEDDFIEALDRAGYALSEENREAIVKKQHGKTNISERKPAAYYYDAATSALVAERECYLIDKYGYKAPI
jgi:hypothetical protein